MVRCLSQTDTVSYFQQRCDSDIDAILARVPGLHALAALNDIVCPDLAQHYPSRRPTGIMRERVRILDLCETFVRQKLDPCLMLYPCNILSRHWATHSLMLVIGVMLEV